VLPSVGDWQPTASNATRRKLERTIRHPRDMTPV
jgi:hypothetical protein